VKEPSGLAFHAQRNTIMLVDDEGTLVELDLDLKEKNRWKVPGDLEGVAVHPDNGHVLVAAERQATVIEYELNKGAEVNRYTLAFASHPEFQSTRDPNAGMEGIALVGNGDNLATYLVIEAAPARLVKLAAKLAASLGDQAISVDQKGQIRPTARMALIEKGWDTGFATLNELVYDEMTKTFLVVCAKEKKLGVLDTSGKLQRTLDLPGPYPEGFCFLPNGDALVVHDSGEGHLIPRFRAAVYPSP
jgi:uncharacterized protein YjiK